MRPAWLLVLSIPFAVGFLIGFWTRGAVAPHRAADGLGSALETPFAPASRAPRPSRPEPQRGNAAEQRPTRRENGAGYGRDIRRDGPEVPDIAVALDDLERALATDDRRGAHEALEALRRSGEPLSSGQIDQLGRLLDDTHGDLLRGLAGALVAAGGEAGLDRLLAFADDPDRPLEDRVVALEGMGDAPPELVDATASRLADILQSDAPHRMLQTAAHTIGNLYRERGVEALLGLVGTRPDIAAEVVFDAIGDIGRPGDAAGLLGLLDQPWSQEDKVGILRAVSRLAARGDDPRVLVDLLREPPAGVSRDMVARSIAESSNRLGLPVLEAALRESAGDPRSQEWIARALTRVGAGEGVAILADALADPEMGLDVRSLARALQDSQGDAATPLILDLLRGHRDQEIIEPLARNLLRNSGVETMDEVLGLLDPGQDAWQRRAVAHALEEGDGAVLTPERLLGLLRNEKDLEVASGIARALGSLHPGFLEERGADLFALSETPAERVALAQLLERQDVPGASARIAEQLRFETDSRVRWEMARTLGRLGEEGIQRLSGLLDALPDEKGRHELLWGLEAARRPGTPQSRELFLRVARNDPSPSIRGQAAEILARQRDPSVIPRLRTLLGTETNEGVQERIREALRELEGR